MYTFFCLCGTIAIVGEIMKLYHVSKVPNIEVLQPKKSTHGVPYVYATSNLELALLFGSLKSYGDFDGSYGTIKGKPYFYEAYPNALKRRFENEECYIYEVDSKTFKRGKTSFKSEVVSEDPVRVLSCKRVDDLYSLLLSLIDEGKIEYKAYRKDDLEYVEMINKHIKDRLISFSGILQNKESMTYKFCKEKFPSLINELESSNEQNKEQ